MKKWPWEALSDIRKISDEVEVIWVKGNHDTDGPADAIAHLIGATFYPKYYKFTSGNKSILCLHGDIFDEFIHKYKIITWIADQIYSFIQYIDRSFYLAKLVKRQSKTYLYCTSNIEKKALLYAKKRKCDVVCCGHSHHPVSTERYYNSGSWVELPCTYLAVMNGTVSLESFIFIK
jgi:UDP-2,3-diacylglucosamine pyrophosphatase LpxH